MYFLIPRHLGEIECLQRSHDAVIGRLNRSSKGLGLRQQQVSAAALDAHRRSELLHRLCKMAPVQIGTDGQLVPLGGPVLSGPQPPPTGGGATQGVRLSLLIEFLLQRTYHEITLLAEL